MKSCKTLGIFDKDGSKYFIYGHWFDRQSEDVKLLEQMGYKLITRKSIPSKSLREDEILYWDSELKELTSVPRQNTVTDMDKYLKDVKRIEGSLPKNVISTFLFAGVLVVITFLAFSVIGSHIMRTYF